jgi:hypothetical protein
MSAAMDFMAAAPQAPGGGNTSWAHRYAGELRRVVHEHAASRPRQLQVHLGPSELGTPCDRQVAGKLARVSATNHVVDPWASIVGTAVHAWLAEAFTADNARHNLRRWVAEQRVVPHPDHPGTADLYDAQEQAVVDHKCLGETSMAKVRDPDGPPIHYQVQLIMYGAGYRAMGLPVKRVALAAYPRTSHTLDGMYVWERPWNDSDFAIVEEVIKLTAVRRRWAEDIMSGRLTLTDVPATPSDDGCYFCPFYRPQAAHDGGPGCPGNRTSH